MGQVDIVFDHPSEDAAQHRSLPDTVEMIGGAVKRHTVQVRCHVEPGIAVRVFRFDPQAETGVPGTGLKHPRLVLANETVLVGVEKVVVLVYPGAEAGFVPTNKAPAQIILVNQFADIEKECLLGGKVRW